MKERLSLVYPGQSSGNYDVAEGYKNALRGLGYHTNTVKLNQLIIDWTEYHRFRGITRGDPNYQYTQQDIVKSASLEAAMRVMENSPDYTIIIDGSSIHKDFYLWMRRMRIPTIVIGTESPYFDHIVAWINKFADYMFVNDKHSAEIMGVPYLPVGYDEEVHHPMSVADTYQSDVVFVGNGYPERIQILSQVDWTDIDFKLFGKYPIDYGHPLAPYYKETVIPNRIAALYYAGSKIVINLNRISQDFEGKHKITEAVSLSARPYEAAACGTLVISEYRPGIYELFGKNAVTFESGAELDSLIHYYLEHDDERREIAKKQHSAVQKHSYTERAKAFLCKVGIRQKNT